MTASPAPGAGSVPVDQAPGTPPDPEIPWRRLSPGMLLVEPVREVIRFIPMLVVLVIAGSGNQHGPPWGLIGTGVVVALGIARYLSTRYRITPAVVEVRRGIVQRRQLTVPRDRIRTMDVSAHPLQRMLRLVRVDIGTGSSYASAPGVRLDGLPAATVPTLRAELLHRANGPPSRGTGPAPDLPGASSTTPSTMPSTRTATTATAVADTGPPDGRDVGPADLQLARLRPGWIALAPATLSGVITGAILIGFGFRLMREARLNPAEFGPVRQLLGFLRGHAVWLDIGLAAGAVVLAVVLLSVAGYVLSFWGFRLGRHPGGTLQVSRGLLTTRSTSIAEHRLRGLQRREPLVLRWVRGARLHAIATGLRRSGGADGGGGSALLMPPAPSVEVMRVEAAVLGDERLVRTPLTAHGPAARRRRYSRALGGGAVVAGVLVAFHWWVGWPAPLHPVWVVIVLGAAWPLAADRYRSLGHAVVDGHLVVRLGSLHRRRSVLAIDGIVGLTMRQSLWQRRAGVATVIATTAAGSQHYDVPDLPESMAIDLARTLLPACRPLIRPMVGPPLRPAGEPVDDGGVLG